MILNLTQHRATPDQLSAGVVDLPDTEREKLSRLLTFETLPDIGEIISRASSMASLAALNAVGEDRYDDGRLDRAAMIGGAPWLMAPLEMELLANGIRPVYAFSVRETQDVPQPDGSVRKVSIFRHVGFVEVE